MELVKGQTLKEFVTSYNIKIHGKINLLQRGSLPENLASKIIGQVLTGLVFAHSKNVSHRDIKPDNIMYDEQTGVVKIIDFGFGVTSKEKLRNFCGTPSYMSPQIVTKRDYWGSKADVWACGIILFTLLTGQLPFKSGSERELFRKIERANYSFPTG